MSAGPPPGIYQDPTDPARQRYWDGAAWGQQLAEPGQPTGTPSPAGAPYGAPQHGLGPATDPWLPTPEASYGTWAPGGWQPAETHNLPGAVRACFAKYATFSGRASRSEFWYFTLFVFGAPFLLGVTIALLDGLVGGLFASEAALEEFVEIVDLLFSLALLVPSLAVSWRRMHDTGRSGIYCLIPIYGWFILPAFKGTPGPNSYG
jgi:uncharacterized membrane protein YhaH (DUF805 family)